MTLGKSRVAPEPEKIPISASDSAPCSAQKRAADCYYLGSHIFACATRHGVVLLDLRRNKYLSVDAGDSRYLAALVQDWPTSVGSDEGDTAALHRAASDALLLPLISTNTIQRHPPDRGGIGRSTFSLDDDLVSIGDEITTNAPVRLAHIAAFMSCFWVCAFALRCLPLHWTAVSVSRRKSRAVSAGYQYDFRKVVQLTSVFRRIRPYVFVANGNCMLHALTLTSFLAMFGEYPAWVFGVRSDPWAAHSWVQYENYLLDTNPDKVCSYEPILSI